MWLWLIPAVLLLAACTPPKAPCDDAYPYTEGPCTPAPTDDEINAAAVQVHSFYRTKMAVPQIVVYEKGDCNFGTTLTLPDGRCVWGTWYPWSNTIYMMREMTTPQGETPLSWQLILAHELLHQFLYDSTGDDDANHTRPEWTTLLPQAVALINGTMGVVND